MPDEYDDFRRRLSNYEKGLYFELGRAHERGETRDRGWVRQFTLKIGKNIRVLDSARTEGKSTRGTERKSGRVNERETLRQLKTERELLVSGQLTRSQWETVAGEKMPRAVLSYMQQMGRDFPGRFQHEIVSRADALRAIQLGQSLAGRQLELVRPYELQRAERARQRLEKIREIVRVRDEKARERAEKFQRMQQFREAAARGRADATERAERDRQAREQATRAKARDVPETERARVEREAAERAAREFPVPSQLFGREATDGGEGVHDKARAEREAAEKAREQPDRAREAAEAAERIHLHREFFAAQRERAERAGILDSVRVVQLQWNQPGEQRQPEPVDRTVADANRHHNEARERERVEERERQRTLGREPD
ncbi:hypothetical protein [Nocardia sp. NBC_00403]|uniref:hypothetical protein n=1 Tax=Nocardia sp. NBC_00403 TaxID=2975990 RepID=UPI002E1F0793